MIFFGGGRTMSRTMSRTTERSGVPFRFVFGRELGGTEALIEQLGHGGTAGLGGDQLPALRQFRFLPGFPYLSPDLAVEWFRRSRLHRVEEIIMFLAFGEIMARVAPQGNLRWRQALPGQVQVTWGGGEANVSASLALLGQPARYLTALPRHAISESLVSTLRGLGVDVDHILWRKEGRLGVYYVEVGANQRGSTVIYDRDHSAIGLAAPEEYDFDAALDGVHWLHVTGITPSISKHACWSNVELVRRAKQAGVTVSCDLNFRKKLWNWRPGTDKRVLARECMSQVLENVDLVIGNEEDASDVLDIHAEGTDVVKGQINSAAYEQVAREIIRQFPNVSRVAITLRESISADHNNWGAMLFDKASDRAYLAPLNDAGEYQPFEIRDIVDRVGGGDSFAGGLLYALNSTDYSEPQQAIAFAVAASCLKHSIYGDFNYVTVAEIAALAGGNATGRVQR